MRLLVVLLLLASSVFSQQLPGEKTQPLFQFGGLNTKQGTFWGDPRFALEYHNLDPSGRLGTLHKRDGYSFRDSIGVGFDSITGLYAAYVSDGQQFLVYAADSANVGYGGLYVQRYGIDSINNATRIWKYWSTQEPTRFAMYNDLVYALNGVQAGVIYNPESGQSVRFPLQAPGEPVIAPITDGSELDGEYRYAVVVRWKGASLDANLGVLSQPVRVRSGRVLLTDFQMPFADSLYAANDSVVVSIYRTVANSGRYESSDTLWTSATARTVDTTSLRTLAVIDSIHDSLLSGAGYAFIDMKAQYGVSAGLTRLRRYGAPGYVSRTEAAYTPATDSAQVGGIFHGMAFSRDTLAVAYAVSFLDTVNSVESDTGRSLYVFDDSTGARLRTVRLSLPPVPFGWTNTIRNLYRAHYMVVGRDTSVSVTIPAGTDPTNWVSDQNEKAGFDLYYIDATDCYISNGTKICKKSVKMHSLTADTVVTSPYYLVEQIAGDSTHYTDSTRYDSLQSHHPYWRTPPSTRLKQPFTYQGRMFGIDGNNLYWSILDSASRWGAFDFISVNKDDGDNITLAFPTRRSIRVFKNKSSYNVYQDGGGQWSLSEVTNGVGCIAPQSHAESPNGHYYLSSEGVILESEGDYLERTYKTGLISAGINNLDKLPMNDRVNAKSIYHDHKYMLCIGDTTYVYDELADAWATWGLTFSAAAVYDTETTVRQIPGNSLYFTQPNSRSLYKFGNSRTDNGEAIWSSWKSAPLLTDDYEEAVTAVGIWFNAIDSSDWLTFYDIVDGRDTTLSNLTVFTDLGADEKYREEAVSTLRTGSYHQILMRSTPSGAGTWDYIDKLNISYVPMGKRERFGTTNSFAVDTDSNGVITFGTITSVNAGFGLNGGGSYGAVTISADSTVLATRQYVRDSVENNNYWTASPDTITADSDHVKIPVYLKVGKRPDDPFSTYVKTFLAADSVGTNAHHIPISGWLSVPIATSSLQHALAGEIYYTAETGTQANSLVGQEISVNVPGRLVFNRATGGYGIYGLIVNGSPKTTNGNGFMTGSRFTGVFIDLGDVSAGPQEDSVRFDTTRAIWIPRLDGGKDDSGYYKFSFWGENNTYTNDTAFARDQIILGAPLNKAGWKDSNLAWIGADTIRGITTWSTHGISVPVISSRGNTSETGMLRLYGDSAQIRILHTLGATYLQFGDSAFTASDSIYLTGYNNTNLAKAEIRADKLDIRTAGNYTWRMPVTTPTDGQVLKVATTPTPDSAYWGNDNAGAGSAWPWSDSSSHGPDSVLFADSSNHADSATGAARAELADSTTRIDTTYAPFQTYVTNHAGTGSTDSFYVAESTLTVTGWKHTGDTIWIDTTGGTGGGISLTDVGNYIDSTTLDTIQNAHKAVLSDSTSGGAARAELSDSTTGGAARAELSDSTTGGAARAEVSDSTSGGAARAELADSATGSARAQVADSARIAGAVDYGDITNKPTIIDSTTGGDGLLETANDLDIVPGFGVLIRGDSVHGDFTELDDSLMRIGTIIDSTTAGNGLIESANDLSVRPGYGIDTVADLVRVDVTDLDDSLMRIGTIIDSTTAGNGLIESANDLAVRPGWGVDTASDLVRIDVTDLDDSLMRIAYEVFEFVTVHGRTTTPTDSVVLTLPQYGPWLLVDSSYDDSKSAVDSFFVSGTIPATLSALDSLIFAYKSSDADSCIIDSIVLWGPDRSNATNMCDSIWYQDGTDRSSASTARVAYYVNESTVQAGDRFALKFRVHLYDNSTNPTMRVAYVQMKGKR